MYKKSLCEKGRRNAIVLSDLLFSDDHNRGHLIILSHRVVEEDQADGGLVYRQSFRHAKDFNIDVVAIDDRCRDTERVFDALAELVRFSRTDHSELIKWRHRIRIESVYL